MDINLQSRQTAQIAGLAYEGPHLVPVGQKFADDVCSDQSIRACYERLHFCSSLGNDRLIIFAI
jgi:hypothetical protein